jgi:hypothetical protein
MTTDEMVEILRPCAHEVHQQALLMSAIETLPWLLPAGTTKMPNWVNLTSRAQIESALDKQMLYVALNNGKFWLARRNGATRTWKRSPERFYIPIKYGFRGYISIDEHSGRMLLRIATSRENAERATQ